MKNLKSVLALVMALCLMLCLAVPAFATETTEGTVVETTAAAAETTAAAAETTAAAAETTAAAAETVDEHAGHDHDEETGEILTTGTAPEETKKMGPVRIILVVLEVIASLVLVVVIMMQSGKEGGMGALSGNAESYMGQGNVAGRDQMLAKATKWVTVIWVVLTMLLTLIP